MYGVDCLVGVMHMLVCPVCGSDEMRECLPYVKYCLYNVCVCVCCAFVALDNKLYTIHVTYIKITHSDYFITQHNQNSHDNRTRGHKPFSRCVLSTISPLLVDCITGLDLISSFLGSPHVKHYIFSV